MGRRGGAPTLRSDMALRAAAAFSLRKTFPWGGEGGRRRGARESRGAGTQGGECAKHPARLVGAEMSGGAPLRGRAADPREGGATRAGAAGAALRRARLLLVDLDHDEVHLLPDKLGEPLAVRPGGRLGLDGHLRAGSTREKEGDQMCVFSRVRRGLDGLGSAPTQRRSPGAGTGRAGSLGRSPIRSPRNAR